MTLERSSQAGVDDPVEFLAPFENVDLESGLRPVTPTEHKGVQRYSFAPVGFIMSTLGS